MKKRKPLVVVALSLITLSIYYLYWLADTRKELNEKTMIKVPSMWLILVSFLGPALFAYAIVLANLHVYSSTSASTTTNPFSSLVLILIYLVIVLLAIPPAFYWYYKFSKAVDAYTNKEVNIILCFILMWILSFIGAAILQDKFNDISGGRPSPQPRVYRHLNRLH
ncbi:MAG TPA: DUF4234 domain-containing protein [Candidatus Saccharimonadales bacterium]|nr:DUF4234 domain-containing protein [Candidatus Saccharimonadales bacterium]